MKLVSVICDQIRYAEFPDLKFGISDNGDAYCDIDQYLHDKELCSTHTPAKFQQKFFYFLTKALSAYKLNQEDIIVINQEDEHHLLLSELALMFIMYTDPNFMFYTLDRIDEMLTIGIAISDTALIQLSTNRMGAIEDASSS